MDDKEFDKYIKDKLQDNNQNISSDWDVMQKILIDKQIIEDNSDSGFDSAVKEQIDAVRAPFNASHWEILHQRLLTERYLKKRLAVVKVIELCMLIMLCTTVITFVPLKTELYAINKYRPTIEKLENLVTSSIDQVSSFFNLAKDDFTKPQKLVAFSDVRRANTENAPAELTLLDSRVSTDLKENCPTLASQIDLLQLPKRDVDGRIEPLLLSKPIQDRQVFTASVGLSANIIETPFDNTIGITALDYTDLSRHVAVTYGIETGRYEVFTGVGFYNTSYSPNISTGVFDSFRGESIPLSEIEEISYSFINIPLGLRYHLKKGNGWSLYAVASANIDALALADYKLNELSAAEKKLAKLSPSTINSSNLRAGIDSDVSLGWLQGGSILDNLNTSASIGFGICTQLDNRMSLFVQPSYTRSFSLNGVGAQDENIDNVKIDLGFRMSI